MVHVKRLKCDQRRARAGAPHSMLLSALLMAASCSESDSEEIPPLGPRPGPGVRPGPSCTHLSDDGSDDEQRQRPGWQELNTTRRGGYDRSTDRRKKVSHAEQAHECFEAVRATALAGKCSSGCIFDCAGTLSRNEMMQCVEHSYGATSWISDEALKVRVRKCAQLHCVPVDHVCSCPMCTGRETAWPHCVWP